MGLRDLNDEQRILLKQKILVDQNENVSYSELANADDLVSDYTLEHTYGDTYFVEDDF